MNALCENIEYTCIHEKQLYNSHLCYMEYWVRIAVFGKTLNQSFLLEKMV